jgi:hypothetical protein
VPFDQLVKPAAEVAEDQRAGYMWLPNERLVRMWLSLHDLYKTKDRVLVGAGLAVKKKK